MYNLHHTHHFKHIYQRHKHLKYAQRHNILSGIEFFVKLPVARALWDDPNCEVITLDRGT